MPRKADVRVEQAHEMYQQGAKLVEIANQLGLPEGTIRSWENRQKWDCNVANGKKRNVAKRKRGGQPGNHNAEGAGAPLKNHNAEKHGLFRKYLPEETFSIIAEMPVNPLDVLWDQIQIAYAAIIRAQQIMYVRDQTDKTREMVSDSAGGESWKTQQAWDKQADFLKSQARAQSELRSMIKQYDEMLHKNWELATDEQKARIEQIRSQTAVQDEKRNRGSDAAAAIVENMQTLAEILKSPQPNRNIEDYEDE